MSVTLNEPIGFYSNAVYYPNWKVYRDQPPSSLNDAFLSHIFYAFAWPTADGTISLSDEQADTEFIVDGVQGGITALKLLRQQHPHIKLLLSIGGSGPGSNYFRYVASNILTRQIFARSAKDLVDMYGFDGVDVDWEHPADMHQGRDYVELLAAVRNHLPHPYYLTSALPAGEWALNHIDVGLASTYLDLINLMAYDFSGLWTPSTGHQAQLFTPQRPHSAAAMTSCHSAVLYLCGRGVPSNKILLGIPTYGRSFLGANNVGQSYVGTGGDGGTFEYRHLPRPGATEYVDTEVGAALCVGGDGGFVSYDNPHTIAMKANYVKQARLAGLFYWEGTGDVSGPRSLVETGYNTLHNL